MFLWIALLLASIILPAYTAPDNGVRRRQSVARSATASGGCCSWNLANCTKDSWCDNDRQQCNACNGFWISAESATCRPRWEGCLDVADGAEGTASDPCCGLSICKRENQWWKACAVPQFCCSWDFATCGDDDWCNGSGDNCGMCGGSFIDPTTRRSCGARWTNCDTATTCCGDAKCITDQSGWTHCDLPTAPTTAPTLTVAVVTPLPTISTPSPTTLRPTSNPTGKPTTSKPTTGTSARPSTVKPTKAPVPTISPTTKPTNAPTTKSPTQVPTVKPTITPTTRLPTPTPTVKQTANPIATTAPPTATLTLPPSSAPQTLAPTTSAPLATPSPIANQTPLPTTTLGPIPSGPFITSAGSSERITIPDPPFPTQISRQNCPHLVAGILDWNIASTWGGSVPSGGNVQLPENTRIVIQQSLQGVFGVITIPVSSELILGENPNGITLDVGGFDVKGKLTAGSDTCRLETPVTITLYGARPSNAVTQVREVTYKGIAVSGVISLHGKRFYRTWTRLAKTLLPGDRVMMLQHQVNWLPGQEVILVTTAMKDSREWHQNEVRIIQGVVLNPTPGVGAAVYLTSSVTYSHVANSGYQAEVGLLTRTIKIQGSAGDSEPTDKDPLNCQYSNRAIYGDTARPCANTELTGFGGHVMVYGTGKGYIEGIELFRMGQTNVLGRYPMHFHLLGNCPECYFRDSSVHRSYYRCVSIHGTNYMNVTENVAFDVTGYCYYLEDGVEHHNTISFNLAAHIHLLGPEAPWGGGQTTELYTQSESLTLPADVTASGFYITNVQNNIIGNAASGGWSGFAFPNLPTPLGPNRSVNMRPSSALPLTIDGNTAHSTGWWWYHGGAFYFGGSLYYNGAGVLEYNAGRDFDFNNHGRNTCQRDLCAEGNCGGWCAEHEKLWVRMTNTKAFLAPNVGLGSWSGRMEIVGFEAHDVGLAIEALEAGFWIDNMLAVCRTGTALKLPPTASASSMSGSGFFWYDTGQEHIITNTVFRSCGYRSQLYSQYDNSTDRGCGDDTFTGCSKTSTVFGFLTHSDQYNPEIMQATKNIKFQKCGRRFSLDNWLGPTAPSTVSGRTQNWQDADGSVSGLGVPALIGSGKTAAGLWWTVDDEVVYDPQGPLKFIKQTKQRGLGHFRISFDSAQHSQVGGSQCGNGGGQPCNPLGYIKHMGKKFSSDLGLPITASPDVSGPVGGFSWLLKLNSGSPRQLKIEFVEVSPDTPMLLSIAYPLGTSFTITANAPSWCGTSQQYSCKEVFHPVNSVADVRNSLGNAYYFSNQGLLTIRIIQTPKDYVGAPSWFLPKYTDIGQWGNGYALPRFERGGVLLPGLSYGPWLDVVANCPASSSNAAYCSQAPPNLDPDVCPVGYTQTAYDKCCSGSTCVYADGSSS